MLPPLKPLKPLKPLRNGVLLDLSHPCGSALAEEMGHRSERDRCNCVHSLSSTFDLEYTVDGHINAYFGCNKDTSKVTTVWWDGRMFTVHAFHMLFVFFFPRVFARRTVCHWRSEHAHVEEAV